MNKIKYQTIVLIIIILSAFFVLSFIPFFNNQNQIKFNESIFEVNTLSNSYQANPNNLFGEPLELKVVTLDGN